MSFQNCDLLTQKEDILRGEKQNNTFCFSIFFCAQVPQKLSQIILCNIRILANNKKLVIIFQF